MDKVPPEICTKIFSQACLDSGYTGRSLSLVSKFIHDTSQPVKLQSISLHGLNEIAAFASLLERTPPHLRRIRYLFITSHELKPTRGTTHGIYAESLAERSGMQVINEAHGPSSQKIGHHATNRFYQTVEGMMPGVVQSILIYAAESAEVLELDCSRFIATKCDTTHPVSFHRLRELTTHGDYLLGLEGCPVIFGPCLRRLHIVHCGYDMDYEFGSIGSLAPSLTHLRVSGLQLEPWFGADLEAALGISKESSAHLGRNRRLPTARLPLSVQKVFVKPAGPPAPTGWCGTRVASYESLLNHLYSLNGKEDRLVLLKEEDELTSSQHVDESDWLNRIAGGEGCWGVNEMIPKTGTRRE